MIMPRKETCSLCGKEYQANCMVIIPPICNECNGVPPYQDPGKINSPEEFREAIETANEKRYGAGMSDEEIDRELNEKSFPESEVLNLRRDCIRQRYIRYKMKNRNVALESAMIGDAVNKLPKEFKWSSVSIWFEGEILHGTASTLDRKNTVTFKDGEWI